MSEERDEAVAFLCERCHGGGWSHQQTDNEDFLESPQHKSHVSGDEITSCAV